MEHGVLRRRFGTKAEVLACRGHAERRGPRSALCGVRRRAARVVSDGAEEPGRRHRAAGESTFQEEGSVPQPERCRGQDE